MGKEITIFVCTDPETRKEMMKFLDKDKMPYVNMLSDVTYEEVTAKIEELEDLTRSQETGYTDLEGNTIETLDEGSKKLVEDLREVLDEAWAGEFGDFTNDKYPAPKIALVEKFEALKQNVINGNYD